MGDDMVDEFGSPLSSTEFLLRLAGRGTSEMRIHAQRQLQRAVERERRAAAHDARVEGEAGNSKLCLGFPPAPPKPDGGKR